MSVETAHILGRDAEACEQVVDHDAAEIRLIANLDTPEADSLVEHLQVFRKLGGTPAQCRAFQETIRRIAGHNGAALALADPLSRRLRERATRTRGLELQGGQRGWSVKRRARALRDPLRALCDPECSGLERDLALSVVASLVEKLGRDQLLDPQVLRELAPVKAACLIGLLAPTNSSAATAQNGDGAEAHEGMDRALHT